MKVIQSSELYISLLIRWETILEITYQKLLENLIASKLLHCAIFFKEKEKSIIINDRYNLSII